MRVVVPAVLAYLSSSLVAVLAFRDQASTAAPLRALVAAVVAAAASAGGLALSGPYAAAGAAVSGLAGHLWPPVVGPRPRGRGVVVAAGALTPLLPVECIAAAVLSLAARRLGARGAAGMAGAAVVVAGVLVRGQPVPHVVAVAATALLLVVGRLGSRTDLADDDGNALRAELRRLARHDTAGA